MLKVTKCIGVKYFVEALINMVCELKITSGCKKKMCKNFMVIRHSIKELLAKSMVTRPMKCIVDKILKKFGMSDCNPKSVPCDCGSGKFNDSESSKLADPKLYRETVGSLIYLMTCTRPDTCYAVTKLSQKLSEPTVADLNMS